MLDLSAIRNGLLGNHFDSVGIIIDAVIAGGEHLPKNALLFGFVHVTFDKELSIFQVIPHFAGHDPDFTWFHNDVRDEASFPPAYPAKMTPGPKHVLKNSDLQRPTILVHLSKLSR